MGAYRFSLLLLALSVLAARSARAADWEVVVEKPYLVKTRPLPGTSIHEVWAEGVVDAPVREIGEAVMDPEGFPRFMPYVKEGRFIKGTEPDGARYVYVRLNFPIVSARDYVTKVYILKNTAPDGSGVFENKWDAVPNLIPSRNNIVRLQYNSGSWNVTPRPDGKSYVVYKFAVDPGGAVPAFAANMGNRSGVPDTFKAVEKEAQRRAAVRKAAEAVKPAPAPVERKAAAPP